MSLRCSFRLFDSAIGDNQYSGPIPIGLIEAWASTLLHLHLDRNLLTGTVPTSLSLMRTLTEILFCGNSLNGTIPTELGLMGNLEVIMLCDNLFTGTIPTEL
jgi:hypothetical protein